jgi:predicted phage replisome organizer
MAEVKWIKITTDMFDNRKIKHLRRMPDGDSLVLIWIMLLTMAGRCNAGGMIFLTENIPYTYKMLADELDFEETTVELAIRAMESLQMISVGDSGFLAIKGWEEYQNTDRMAEIREYNRLAKQKSREKQRLLLDVNDKSMTSQCGHATDIDIEEDKDIDKEIEKEIEIDLEGEGEQRQSRTAPPYQEIVDIYNSVCTSFPKLRAISDARKRAIGARLKTYTLEDFKTLFEKAEASRFLKGANDRNWSATFDWLITDSNMAKVLDGNYDDNKTPAKRQTPQTQTYVRESPTRGAVEANNRALERMLATEG